MNRIVILIIAGLIIIGGGTTAGLLIANRSSDNTSSGATASQVAQPVPTAEPVQTQQQITQRNCLADTCLQISNLNYPVATLPASVQTAMSKALDNEYKLQAYYQAVISKFGDKRPFAMILGAEAQHIAVTTSLYEKYGLAPAADQWASQSYSLATFSGACQAAAGYERDTVNLYNQLLPQVSSYPDITQVFTNIKEAAQTSHLPAFEKCS